MDMLIQELQKVALHVRELEEEARVALYELEDKQTYKQKLTEKTLLLISLPSHIASLGASFSPALQAFIKDKVGGMAYSAEKAQKLDSLFYMSALLYPIGYKEGDANDLETFIDELRRD